MIEHEIIHARVWNPCNSIFKTSKNDRSECTIVKCSNKSNCELYAKGQCMMIGILTSKCPYGIRNVETGWTKNAKKFSSWIRERTEQYKVYLDKLQAPSKKIASVGEYVYLPYSHMNFDSDIPFLAKSGFMKGGSPLLKKEYFTKDVVRKLICHRPQEMFGGEISSYQKEEVPKFIKHMQEQYPDLLNEVMEENEGLKFMLEKVSNIGRKAYLWTLEKNITIHDKEYTWHWDGQYLTSNNAYLPFTVVSYQNKEVKIKPIDKAVIKVEFDNWCNDDTVFID